MKNFLTIIFNIGYFLLTIIGVIPLLSIIKLIFTGRVIKNPDISTFLENKKAEEYYYVFLPSDKFKIDSDFKTYCETFKMRKLYFDDILIRNPESFYFHEDEEINVLILRFIQHKSKSKFKNDFYISIKNNGYSSLTENVRYKILKDINVAMRNSINIDSIFR